ncbi:MAG TPA: Ig-like domain-containing protein [Thermoanaerobaculia bacterium]|nr:Ig-like domain-containing protein [Thermoanaerobaculia bacterium]
MSIRPPHAVLLLALLLLLVPATFAADPPSGTVSDGNDVNWTGGPLPSTASANCGGPNSPRCDNFKLTLVPPSYSFELEVILTPQGADDWDLQIYGPDNKMWKGSGNSPGQQESVVLINPPAGTYTVTAAPFLVALPYNAYATVRPHTATPGAAPSAERPPTYATHAAPPGIGQGAGEPTLGVNESTGNIMYISGLETLRVKMNADGCATSPGRATWEDVSFLTTQLITFDPILYVQQDRGRTIVSQLLFPTKQSAMAISDNDGTDWTPSQGSGISTGVDHQGVGGGPWRPGTTATYDRAIYYCAQDIALAECAVSVDGGLTFGPGVPIYNLTECGGLHGHPKVAPDGTVYVPNKGCTDPLTGATQPAVVVSTENGALGSWRVKRIPDGRSGEWDPSVAIGANGTVYFAYDGVDGHPKVAVSRDRGETWSPSVDVGSAFDIRNTAFPVIIAGDDDRAAFAFLGTSQVGGGSGDDPTWPGTWYLYVAHTYDGGKTWVTVNATPNDPVQRGTICSGGISCGSTRNLLDFMDITVDQEGRALVAFADGCTGACVRKAPNSFSEVGSIARQVNGKRLYARFDVPGLPEAPTTNATLKNGVVYLNWQAPDDHGSLLTAYNIYERSEGSASTLIASVHPSIRSYSDATPAGFYEVRAVNAHGESRGCEVVPVLVVVSDADTCNLPGERVNTDPQGDSSFGALDVLSVDVAEPAQPDGVHRVTFTLKVHDLSKMSIGNAWYIIWNRPIPDDEFDRNYVVMRATGTDTAVFKYGRVSPPSVNQSHDLGDADSGSFSKAGNTITITISTDKIDSPEPLDDLSGVHVRAFLANVDGQVVTQATAQDFTAPANYNLRGTAHCTTNRAPVAVNDSATTRENKPVGIRLLANDSDADGDPLTVTELSKPSNGTVLTKKDGNASYKPNAGFTGTDSFMYTISDGQGGTASATVTITVTPK